MRTIPFALSIVDAVARSAGTTARTFNLNGYGLVLVDAQDMVRSINPRGEGLEAVVERVLREQKPAR
jgi:hypothetical protein